MTFAEIRALSVSRVPDTGVMTHDCAVAVRPARRVAPHGTTLFRQSSRDRPCRAGSVTARTANSSGAGIHAMTMHRALIWSRGPFAWEWCDEWSRSNATSPIADSRVAIILVTIQR